MDLTKRVSMTIRERVLEKFTLIIKQEGGSRDKSLQKLVEHAIETLSEDDLRKFVAGGNPAERDKDTGKYKGEEGLKRKRKDMKESRSETTSKQELWTALGYKQRKLFRLVLQRDNVYKIVAIDITNFDKENVSYREKLKSGNWGVEKTIKTRAMELHLCDICGVPYTFEGFMHVVEKWRKSNGKCAPVIRAKLGAGRRANKLSKYNLLENKFNYEIRNYTPSVRGTEMRQYDIYAMFYYGNLMRLEAEDIWFRKSMNEYFTDEKIKWMKDHIKKIKNYIKNHNLNGN